MKKRACFYIALLLCLLAAIAAIPPTVAQPRRIVIDDFAAGLNSNWQEKSFVGHTIYTVVEDQGRHSLEAKSEATASGLFYKIEYEPAEYPVLKWSWKVEGVIEDGDVRYKQSDDCPARIYVVFPSLLFWRTRALCYIWANKAPVGAFIPNPHVKSTIMIVVQSGQENAGQWMDQQADIVADFRRAFGQDPPKAGAIALMTDADNTGSRARAWYGPISISAQP
ncbi:MAG: DUF3047 domain-containing protein [Desulfatibacillaceae bacterium]|nr:DUF3047 domain-containing protein [Desulfatibacillaceae bacterium]